MAGNGVPQGNLFLDADTILSKTLTPNRKLKIMTKVELSRIQRY